LRRSGLTYYFENSFDKLTFDVFKQVPYTQQESDAETKLKRPTSCKLRAGKHESRKWKTTWKLPLGGGRGVPDKAKSRVLYLDRQGYPAIADGWWAVTLTAERLLQKRQRRIVL